MPNLPSKALDISHPKNMGCILKPLSRILDIRRCVQIVVPAPTHFRTRMLASRLSKIVYFWNGTPSVSGIFVFYQVQKF